MTSAVICIIIHEAVCSDPGGRQPAVREQTRSRGTRDKAGPQGQAFTKDILLQMTRALLCQPACLELGF